MENDVSTVFVATVTFLPSHYLAMIGGYTRRHTDRWQRFMEHAIELGTGAVVYTYQVS
jgi:hypothetical protein